jgi:hypothetical protein
MGTKSVSVAEAVGGRSKHMAQVPDGYKILNGAFAGVVGMATVFPLDTIKTVMQAAKPSECDWRPPRQCLC